MVIDQAKCTGCGDCTMACRASNDVAKGKEWNIVLQDKPVGGKPVYLPRPCMHCEHPPCAEVCPVGATYKRDDGIVMMDYDKCIGCRYCEVACPYGARVSSIGKRTRNRTTPCRNGARLRSSAVRAVCRRSVRSAINALIADSNKVLHPA